MSRRSRSSSPRPVAGRVVAITGGARGIGRATAAALLASGARVAIGDLDPELSARAADELGHGAVGLELDVTDRPSFAAFLDAVEERLGPLDVLVNNAGIMLVGRFVDEDDAAALRQIDVNLRGVIHGMKLVLPRMQARGAGHVVNVASTAGKVGVPGGATYSATKHAVVGLTEAVRLEARGTGVEFSIVMPVPVNTQLAAGLAPGRGIALIEPEDVAAAILGALRHPRVDVYVPASVGRITRTNWLLARPLREALSRAMKVDRILAGSDPAQRAAYEQRAQASQSDRKPAGVS